MKYSFKDFTDGNDTLEVSHEKRDRYIGFYSHGYVALNKATTRKFIALLQEFLNDMGEE